MAIKRIDSMSLARVFVRALCISTLKNVAYNTIVILSILFVFGLVPGWLYQYGFFLLFLGVTYVFAEWIFNDLRLGLRIAVGITVASYVWDSFVSILIWNYFTRENLFVKQRLIVHTIFFTLHAVAMLGAWVIRRRVKVNMSLAEGLES